MRGFAKWPRIRRRRYRRSGTASYQVDLGAVNGRRVRKQFPTKDEAVTFAQRARTAREREGAAAFSIPSEVRVETARCIEMLAPHGATLTEAVRYYLEHFVSHRSAPQVAEMATRLLEDTKSAGRRERTIRGLRNFLHNFSREFGDRQLTDITVEELQHHCCPPRLAPRTRLNNLRTATQLYNYAIKNGWGGRQLGEAHCASGPRRERTRCANGGSSTSVTPARRRVRTVAVHGSGTVCRHTRCRIDEAGLGGDQIRRENDRHRGGHRQDSLSTSNPHQRHTRGMACVVPEAKRTCRRPKIISKEVSSTQACRWNQTLAQQRPPSFLRQLPLGCIHEPHSNCTLHGSRWRNRNAPQPLQGFGFQDRSRQILGFASVTIECSESSRDRHRELK